MKRKLISSVVLVALALSAGAPMAAEEGPIRRARLTALRQAPVGVTAPQATQLQNLGERSSAPVLERTIVVDPIRTIQTLSFRATFESPMRTVTVS